jgi:hypothetical protein
MFRYKLQVSEEGLQPGTWYVLAAARSERLAPNRNRSMLVEPGSIDPMEGK